MISGTATACLLAVLACNLRQTVEAGRPADIVVVARTVVIGILARCLWVSVYFRGLQRRLAEKNSALKLAVARIEGMANLDELTGLSNRRSITNHLTEQMAHSDRTLTPLSVAILDIDHFKSINDTYVIWRATVLCSSSARL